MFSKRHAASTSRGATRRAIVVAGCLAGVLAPATAQAAPGLDVYPSLGTSQVAVGAIAQGQLTITNHSTAPEDAGYLTLNELTLVPSCGAEEADRGCLFTPPGADPGVITLADTATGSGACTGNTFSVAVTDVLTGKVSLTTPPGAPVVLGTGPASSTCVVSYTYTVNRVATKDSSPAAGTQTDLVAYVKATASWNGLLPSDTGYATVTVVRDTPDLVTRASSAVQVGGQLSAATTLTGSDPDGNVTFKLYGPGDPSCAGTPLHSNTVTVDGNGTYSSTTAAATQPGMYRWTASYGGDDDNDAVRSACDEAAAATSVSAVSPPPPPPPPLPPPPPPPATPGTDPGTTPGAGGTGGTGGPGDTAQPKPPVVGAEKVRLDGFGLTRKTFARAKTSTALAATAAATKTRRKKTAKGTTIKFKLSSPATVTILVERATKGRRSGAKCVKATKKLKKKKPCTLYVKSTTLKRTFRAAGAKKVAFSGRAGRRAMAVGSYRMRATATAGVGTTSVPRTAKFKIVRK